MANHYPRQAVTAQKIIAIWDNPAVGALTVRGIGRTLFGKSLMVDTEEKIVHLVERLAKHGDLRVRRWDADGRNANDLFTAPTFKLD